MQRAVCYARAAMILATKRRAVVDSFAELVSRPFAAGINALCWPRLLAGDFDEVARALAPSADEGVVVVDIDMLRAVSLSAAGRIAADVLIDDLRHLDALGREPVLNCITRYPRDERGLAIVTDVMSFHVDRAPVEVDTWLCTYAGAPSEGLDNDDARRHLDDPAIRAALLRDRDDDDEADDDAFIEAGSFDLHYASVDGAEAFSFGVGHLWRIAVQWPGCPVPPCIHRAPTTTEVDTPRLLLIC